jgi:fimbrial isopeptide formation D2 family protein
MKNQLRHWARGAVSAVVGATALVAGVVGTAVTSNAAPADDTTITLKAAEGESLTGHSFNFYRIGTYYGAASAPDGTVSDTSIQSVPEYDSWVRSALGKESIDVPDGEDATATLSLQTGATLRRLAVDLASDAGGQTPTLANQSSNETSHAFTVHEGLYLITDTHGSPVILGTKIDGKEMGKLGLGEAYIKSDSVKVKKQVKSVDTGAWLDNDAVTVGETRDFKAVFALPNKLAFKHVTVNDEMTGMSYVDGTFKAMIGDTNVTNRFTLSRSGNGFSLTSDDSLIQDFDSRQVTLTYSAKVTSPTGVNKITVTLDPFDGQLPPGTNPPSGTDHNDLKSYAFDLHKVNKLDASVNVQNAGFKLHDDSTNTWLSWDNGTSSWTTNASDAQERFTDADGMISYTGIGSGKYTLYETTVPDHYMGLIKPSFSIHIDDNGIITITPKTVPGFVDTNVNGTDLNTAKPVIQVKNMPNLNTLPHTGSTALMLVCMLGVLLALAGIAFGIRTRMITKKNL